MLKEMKLLYSCGVKQYLFIRSLSKMGGHVFQQCDKVFVGFTYSPIGVFTTFSIDFLENKCKQRD